MEFKVDQLYLISIVSSLINRFLLNVYYFKGW